MSIKYEFTGKKELNNKLGIFIIDIIIINKKKLYFML